MKKLILFAFVLWVSSGLTGCARNPVTGKRQVVLVSENQEIAMGRESDPEVREEYGVAENPPLQNYVDGMGRKLVRVSHRPNLAWHFTVVDSPVVNAFAIPGGYVYLTRGILAYLGNEAELAE
jgi:predicted Zn-dependent protease